MLAATGAEGDASRVSGGGVARTQNAIRILRIVLGAVLIACVALFVILTWRWPLVGDVAMVHYLIVLMRHGMAPYRQIVDAQMPGTYLVEWAAIHIFGAGAFGVRLYDWSILALAGISMYIIARPYDGFAGLFAGAMLTVIHGRDGLAQAAQRDLTIAALLLASYACAFVSVRRSRPWMLLLTGASAGLAVTIKPTVLPFGIVLLALAWVHLRRIKVPFVRYCILGVVGLALPALACVVFLVREQAIPAFLDAVHGMWPYYAGLARQPVSRILQHGISPLLTLILFWFATLAAEAIEQRTLMLDWERGALWAGVLLALASDVAQGKGFPYHRYPLLAFLLITMALDFCMALRRGRVLRVLGVLGLVAGALGIAPISVWKMSHYDWRYIGPQAELQSDLARLGGANLSGHVQCLDAYSGCISTLDRMNLAQSTGFLVDFYFWMPTQTPVTEAMRARFWQAIAANPPEVFVVSQQTFPESYNSYDKLRRWAEFNAYLNANYVLAAECKPTRKLLWTNHPETATGFRIYLRKGSTLFPQKPST